MWLSRIASLQKGKKPLCLDVGCGANPFPEADVVCDLHIEGVPDRRMKALVTKGKPFVLCDCCFLPFKDKVFGFVTVYYLIEHIENPRELFSELKRVSEHGYIQCPSWFNEIVYGEDTHNWIVMKRDGKLYIRPISNKKGCKFQFGFVFHRLYRLNVWRILHAIIDETMNLFSVHYKF